MPLFDEFERVETRPSRQNESAFEYLNLSARPWIHASREFLERWFEHLLADAQADVRGRFRSPAQAQHQSAFFELYWHELLRCTGYEVGTHPPLPDVSTNPDFLALRNRERQFYLEATLALPPGDPAADRRFAGLLDTLDRTDSPDFFLEVEFRGSPQANLRGRIIRERLEQWLSTLDHARISQLFEQQDYDAVPKLNWTEQGCALTFTPIPKGPEFRGKPDARPVGVVFPTEMRELRTHDDIRVAINEKATKYGNLDRPLIVSVNVLDDFCDDYDIWNALFGEEQIVVIRQAVGQFRHELTRAQNGAWRGGDGRRNRFVSAVSIVHQVSPATLRARPVTLIHNPWAVNPLPMNALSIPQVTFSVPDGHLQRSEGQHPADILGIPNPWPPPD